MYDDVGGLGSGWRSFCCCMLHFSFSHTIKHWSSPNKWGWDVAHWFPLQAPNLPKMMINGPRQWAVIQLGFIRIIIHHTPPVSFCRQKTENINWDQPGSCGAAGEISASIAAAGVFFHLLSKLCLFIFSVLTNNVKKIHPVFSLVLFWNDWWSLVSYKRRWEVEVLTTSLQYFLFFFLQSLKRE